MKGEEVLNLRYNPVLAPPLEVIPLWPEFWVQNKDIIGASRLFNWTIATEIDTTDLDAYLASLFFKTQCSMAGVQRFFETKLRARKREFVLHHVNGGFLTYIRADLRSYVDDYGVGTVLIENKAQVLWQIWLDGWFCNPFARYYGRLELTSIIDVQRLADPEVDLSTRIQIACDYLNFHRISIARKKFDCLPLRAMTNKRGWGGTGSTERYLPTVNACERHCRMSPGCQFWTYDAVGYYGQTLCWIWQDNEPDEVRDETGWYSGYIDQSPAAQVSPKNNLGHTNSMVPMVQKPEQLPEVTESLLRVMAVDDLTEVSGLKYLLLIIITTI